MVKNSAVLKLIAEGDNKSSMNSNYPGSILTMGLIFLFFCTVFWFFFGAKRLSLVIHRHRHCFDQLKRVMNENSDATRHAVE